MPINENCLDLNEFLLENRDKTILFAGIGNVLRKDDGSGVYISRNIRENGKISALTVEVCIENYIGKINRLNPDILILIDCMDLGQIPGAFRMLNPENITDHTFNTHNISLNRLGEFFRMPVHILGIQPESITFGEDLSDPVKESADRILKVINRNIQQNSD